MANKLLPKKERVVHTRRIWPWTEKYNGDIRTVSTSLNNVFGTFKRATAARAASDKDDNQRECYYCSESKKRVVETTCLAKSHSNVRCVFC